MNELMRRHPDIPKHIANECKKYVNLDENGNVIECLERKSVDEDFVDVTAIEKERRRIAEYTKELNRLERKAKDFKEGVPDYETKNNIANRNN